MRFQYVNDLWEKLTKTLSDKEVTQVTATRKFAEAIKYTHSGLSPSEYFLHPLRVGSIAGIIISLMFFYLISLIFILGAEFNYHFHRTYQVFLKVAKK